MRIAWVALLCVACGPMLPDGRVYSNSPGLAAANIAVGAALYVGAGGCKISGCPTNTRCNVVTERCDPIECDKVKCGPDSVCDEKSGECIPAGLPASTSATTTPAVPTPIAGPNANN